MKTAIISFVASAAGIGVTYFFIRKYGMKKKCSCNQTGATSTAAPATGSGAAPSVTQPDVSQPIPAATAAVAMGMDGWKSYY
jgi:hypothetical protein